MTAGDCDWVIEGRRCGRTDIAIAGDGPHVCTVHVDEWLASRREEMEREYVTRSTVARIA
mgnify:CR=1 FL=1